jgi:hypothetical protein
LSTSAARRSATQPREAEWDPDFMMLIDPAGRRPTLSLQLAQEPPEEPVRVHVDLYTSE